MKGRFITFEGPEGAGKTTQIQRLKSRLDHLGISVLLLREPGGTALGEWVRKVVQHGETGEDLDGVTELFLFNASRRHLVRSVIAPALEKGIWVICDRFFDSTTVYQGYAGGVPVGFLEQVNQMAVGACVPDRTILLDLDPEVGLMRIQNRKVDTLPDSFETRAISFHEKVREGYLLLAEQQPDRFWVVQADQPVEKVSEDVWEGIHRYVE